MTPPSPGRPSRAVERRDFLKLVTLGTAATFLPRAQVMAGPFERADFEKLVPAEKKLDPAWVRSLFERGEPAVYRGAELRYIGMPVGGLGAGQLYLGGEGQLWHWDIFNQTAGTGAAHYAKPPEPSSPVVQGFSLMIGPPEARVTRQLDRTGFGDITFRGEYPIGTVQYRHPESPVTVTLEAFSPFIPLNTEDSSLPATVLHFTLKNTSAAPVTALLVGALQNVIGRSSPSQNATRRTTRVQTSEMTLLAYSLEPGGQAEPPPRPDVVFEDWSRESFEGWTVEGTAFGSRPAKRADIPHLQGDLGGDGGNVAVSFAFAPGSTVTEKDGATGKLTSRAFAVERHFIDVWVGGGNHPGRTCLNLLVDGKVVRSVTGANSNRQSLHSISVQEFAGKEATLQIVDAESGAWGNISVGRITFTDRPGAVPKLEEMPDFGTMALALLGPPADVAETELSDRPAPDAGRPPTVGRLGRELRLDPGATAEVTFLLAWHFPNLELEGLGKVGRHYAVKFANAQAVAEYVAANFDRLSRETRLWRDTWYNSTLPYWFLDRTLLNASILATSTCYRFRDGRFYAWEGVGCCKGTCTHVWHYAHAAARLFPELERDTRERVDLGIALNPETGVMGFRAEFDRHLAVDGQAGTILRFYREHLMSADEEFLRRNWTKIKLTLEPLLALDRDRDGVLEGPQMNTLDTPWYGKIPWLSSLYLAAMQAAATMALDVGDCVLAARCLDIANRGAENLTAQCFEGDYYVNRIDPAHPETINSGTGCEIDQVLGQSWAFQVGLGRVLPEQETRAALASLWRYNFTPDVGPWRAANRPGRWYAMAGEAGLLMCTFPRTDWDFGRAHGQGNPGFAGYFNECMNGFEYQVAGHMIAEGMLMEGLAVTRAVHDRYHPSRRNPWNEIECGDHYARSMASYGVFIAACGFEHHGPRGHLGFAPKLRSEDFRAPFTVAEGWGTYEQTVAAGQLTARVHLRWGSLRLRTVGFALPQPGLDAVRQLSLSLAGRPLAGTHATYGRRVIVTLAKELRLTPAETLEIQLS